MTSSLITDPIEPARPASPPGMDMNRLRALRARGTSSPQARYSSPPTGWGRWPTCACPRENRAADGSCC